MLDTRRPFTRAEARAAGITDTQLRGAKYVRLLGGVYVGAGAPDLLTERARAALHVHPPTAVATHLTAARLHGAPVTTSPAEHVTVSRAEDRRQRHGVRCHVAALGADDITLVRGLRISAPHRMFVELASLLPLVELVVVGDWLVRRQHVTCSSLVDYCTSSHAPHARAAAVAAAYVRDRVDSPMESRLRMLVVLAGLPEPEVNLTIRSGDGVVRLDLSYPSVRLAVEYDGRHHLDDVAQWERDPRRRDDLEHQGWRVLVITAEGIYKDPASTVLRIWRALKERGYRGLRRPRDAWRPHFEERTGYRDAG